MAMALVVVAAAGGGHAQVRAVDATLGMVNTRRLAGARTSPPARDSSTFSTAASRTSRTLALDTHVLYGYVHGAAVLTEPAPPSAPRCCSTLGERVSA